MRHMRVKNGLDEAPWHVDDSDRLVQIAANHGGILSVRDAHQAWEDYSASMDAGWMHLYLDDETTWQRVLPFLEDA